MSCPFSEHASNPRKEVGSLPAEWSETRCVDLLFSHGDPPHNMVILQTLEYLRLYFQEWVYMTTQGQEENGRSFKRNVYTNLRTLFILREMRIRKLPPAMHWSHMWDKLHNAILPDGVRSKWYMVTHGIAPTNGRLHKILLMIMLSCTHCRRKGTMLQRHTKSGERGDMVPLTNSSDRESTYHVWYIHSVWLLFLCF
jgi:hypothetical protein